MARAKRLLPSGCSFHITLRCNSRQFLIAKALRRDVLLAVLKKAQQKFAVKVYGLCLMANHLHLLLRPDDASELPRVDALVCLVFSHGTEQVERALWSFLGGQVFLNANPPQRSQANTEYLEVYPCQSQSSWGKERIL